MTDMGKLSRILTVVGSLGVLAPRLVDAPVFAQAGSTGGTIGKTNKSVSGGGRGVSGAARKISRDTASFSRAPFGTGRRHMGGVGNTQLPSGVDAYDFGQQWRDKRRRRDRASFAGWCCQGKRSCPCVQIRFRRSRSRRTSVRDSCRSDQLPRTVDGDKVMIVCRVPGSDHRHAVNPDHYCRLGEA